MPIMTRVGNQPYMFAGILAHNLIRELRIEIDRRARGTTPKRAALRCFLKMETLCRTPVRRTGRIIRPGDKLILSMNGNDSLEGKLRYALTVPNAAADRPKPAPAYATIGLFQATYMWFLRRDIFYGVGSWPCGHLPRGCGFPRRPRADRLPSKHPFRTP